MVVNTKLLLPWDTGEHSRLTPVKGSGVSLIEANGREYIDACSGLFVCSAGYGNKRISQAISDVSHNLGYGHNFLYQKFDQAEELSRLLCDLLSANYNKVFLGATGSDAIDTAAKITWRYHKSSGNREKTKILARSANFGGSIFGNSISHLPPFESNIPSEYLFSNGLTTPYAPFSKKL